MSEESLVSGVVGDGREPREWLAEFARDNREEIEGALRDAMRATKVSVSIVCKSCSKEGFYSVAVPDSKATAQFAAMLLDQGFGKPATEPGAAEQSVTVAYSVVLGDAEREEAIHAAYRSLLADAASLEGAREAGALLTVSNERRGEE